MPAGEFAQACGDPPPRPVEAPRANIPLHAWPGAILACDVTPGAATAQEIEHPIDDASDLHRARSAAWLSSWKEGGNRLPFCIGKVTRIDLHCPAGHALRIERETLRSERLSRFGFPFSHSF
jgi:hypothetical protein